MNILITGANRGLGKKIKHFCAAQQSNCHFYLSARDVKKIEIDRNQFTTNNHYHCFEFDLIQPYNQKFMQELPELDVIFHTASPYSLTRILNADITEKKDCSTAMMTDALFLSDVITKLKTGGTLIAAGAIVADVFGSPKESIHPWYAGLFSLYKASLRNVMAALYYEVKDKKIIYANLGAFVDKENQASSIEEGAALDIDDVAQKLIHLALAKNTVSDFDVNILSPQEIKQIKSSVHDYENSTC